MSTGYTAGDIAGLRRELTELKQQINELEPKLKAAPRQLETFKELEAVALRFLVIINRLNLPEDVEMILDMLARLLVMMRMVQMAMATSVGGPTGLAMGILSAAGAGMTLSTFMQRPSY